MHVGSISDKLFADAGNGVISGTNIEYMAQRLSRVCRDLFQCGKKCALTFNASKTVVILFSKYIIMKESIGAKR